MCWLSFPVWQRRSLILPPVLFSTPCTPQELATLQILLLYSTPFKEVFGESLLAFYPHIGGEALNRAGRLLLLAVCKGVLLSLIKLPGIVAGC